MPVCAAPLDGLSRCGLWAFALVVMCGQVRHLRMLPQGILLRWYSEACPGTSSVHVLFGLGEEAGSCLRIVSSDGNTYNRALMGYVVQSHVRALVVFDATERLLRGTQDRLKRTVSELTAAVMRPLMLQVLDR